VLLGSTQQIILSRQKKHSLGQDTTICKKLNLDLGNSPLKLDASASVGQETDFLETFGYL
jgi:hypothetical protein